MYFLINYTTVYNSDLELNLIKLSHILTHKTKIMSENKLKMLKHENTKEMLQSDVE